ncbi:hypothetical protein LUZ60_016765 [Juncus effusus]|nr:hypothetical protein LUZ60_016765 [Juncus effusus]
MSDQSPPPPPPPLSSPFSPLNPNPNSISAFPQAKRKRTGFRRKAANLSASPSSFASQPPSNPNPNPTASVSADLSDEIIVINKDATAEAVTALTAGFPADSLTDEEIEAGVVSDIGGIEQVNYILIRNHILSKWRENVSNWVHKEPFIPLIPPHCQSLLSTAYNYLLSHGYINFGIAPNIKSQIPTEPSKSNVIIIGSGLAGLAAARQLISFGFKVLVLEGRKRCGGRVYTKKMEGNSKFAFADLGGSVLTGTLGNPLAILAKQLGVSMHKIRDKCPLYRPDGQPVDPILDQKVETSYNKLLDKVSNLRQSMGDVAMDVSLGAGLEMFRDLYGELGFEETRLFNWHLANLEYANAGLIGKLSLAYWDQDDPYDMGGDHCFLPGGNGRLVQALAEGVNIVYEKTVHTIRYSVDGVQVLAGAQTFHADAALCTVPLGVLKNKTIKFVPELPQRKLDSVRRLGFGLLNKVAMLFPHVFWRADLDTFGHLSEETDKRGEFFLFYSYASVAGGPLLIALVAGEAAGRFESMPPTDAVTKVLQILRGIYTPQGIEVPDPLQSVCTRWGTDSFSLGSYSHVAVGATGDDYDVLAEPVGDGRLFFAGEATTRRYPATMHGAFISGLREASHIKSYTSSRLITKSPSMNSQSCVALLADLFREPDLEFGGFSVIFQGRRGGDLKAPAVVRVSLGGARRKGEQLQSQQSQSRYGNSEGLSVYLLLCREQVLELREVRGGDEMRVNYLCEKLGVKLIGRKGLGPGSDSVIAAIKAERSKRRSKASVSS